MSVLFKKIYSKYLSYDSKYSLVLIISLLISPYMILGPYSLVLMHDNGDSVIPFMLSYKHIDFLSAWNPFQMGGVPRFSQGFKTGYLALLFSVLPVWWAYLSALIVHSLVGAFGFTKVYTELTGIKYSKLTAWVCLLYIVYTLHWGMLVYYSEFWIIAISAVYLHYSDRLSNINRIFLAAFLGLITSLFSSSFTIISFVWLIFPLVVFVKYYNKPINVVLISLIYSLFFFIGMMPELGSLLSNSKLSHRDLLQVYDLSNVLGILIPSLHSPVSLFSFIPIIFFARLSKRCKVIVLIYFSIIALYTIFFIGFNYIEEWIPLSIRNLNYTRLQFPTIFLQYIISGIGLSIILNMNTRYKFVQMITPIVLSLIPFIVILKTMATGWVLDGNAQSYNTEQYKVIADLQGGELGKFRVSSIAMLSALPAAYGLEAAGGYLNMYSKRYKYFYSTMMTPESAENIPEYVQKTSEWGNQLGLNCVFNEQITLEADNCFDSDLVSLANIGFIFARNPVIGRSLENISSPEIRFHDYSQTEKIKKMVTSNLGGDAPINIMKVKNPVDRFFLASNIRVVEDWEEMKHDLRSQDLNSLTSTALILKEDYLPRILNDYKSYLNAHTTDIQKSEKIERLYYYADKIAINVTSQKSAILVASNSYSPYWSAKVNGDPAIIFPVYGAFWGIIIPKGFSKVEYEYNEPRLLSKFFK